MYWLAQFGAAASRLRAVTTIIAKGGVAA